MSDRPDRFELLEGMDAPRPLPDELRQRLEQLLLPADELPLPLGDEQRATLVAVLPRRHHVRLQGRPAWIGTGVAAAAVGVLGALLLTSGGSPLSPGTAALPGSTVTSEPPAIPGVSGGVGPVTGGAGEGATTGGSTGGGVASTSQGGAPNAAATPTAAPPAGAAVAAPAPQSSSAGTTPAPFTVSAISPTSGPITGGTRVRISGTSLHDARSVLFGSQPGTKLVVESDRSLTVLTPAAGTPQTVTVTVQLSRGQQAQAPQRFRYRLV